MPTTFYSVLSEDDAPQYTPPVAAQLARVSLSFVRLCEREGLSRPRPMRGGALGYGMADIQHLARIRRLRDVLDLDLPAVEVVLNLRRRVLELLAEMEEMERRMTRREQELLGEIRELRRRLAVESRWREW